MPKVTFLTQPGGTALGGTLLAALADAEYTRLYASVAYAKRSGVAFILASLVAFQARGDVSVTVGIDQQGTSLEALQDLYLALGGEGAQLFVLRNPAGNPSPSFHPKVWFFLGTDAALLVCGSGNLTAGGLFGNYEATLIVEFDTGIPEDLAIVDSVSTTLVAWADPTQPHIVQVTAEVLTALHASGELPSESAINRATRVARAAVARIAGTASRSQGGSGLFRGKALPLTPEPPPRPALPAGPVVPMEPPVVVAAPGGVQAGAGDQFTVGATGFLPKHRRLLMVVQPRQKTEIYLSKGVLLSDEAFFNAPFRGLTNPRRPGNPGQPQPDPLPIVEITVFSPDGSVAGSVRNHPLKMWTYSNGASANDDFRITFPSELLALVPDDAVLTIEKDPRPGVEFALTVYPPGHAAYVDLRERCTLRIPNSSRRYGWE